MINNFKYMLFFIFFSSLVFASDNRSSYVDPFCKPIGFGDIYFIDNEIKSQRHFNFVLLGQIFDELNNKKSYKIAEVHNVHMPNNKGFRNVLAIKFSSNLYNGAINNVKTENVIYSKNIDIKNDNTLIVDMDEYFVLDKNKQYLDRINNLGTVQVFDCVAIAFDYHQKGKVALAHFSKNYDIKSGINSIIQELKGDNELELDLLNIAIVSGFASPNLTRTFEIMRELNLRFKVDVARIYKEEISLLNDMCKFICYTVDPDGTNAEDLGNWFCQPSKQSRNLIISNKGEISDAFDPVLFNQIFQRQQSLR